MSLEEAINGNTAAVIMLTEMIKANGSCAPTTEKPARVRRTKKEMEKAKEVEVAVVEKEKDPLDILNGPEEADIKDPAPTIDQVRAEASAVVDLDKSENQGGLGGLALAQKIISELGYKTIPEVPEDKRQLLIDAFRQGVKTWGKK